MSLPAFFFSLGLSSFLPFLPRGSFSFFLLCLSLLESLSLGLLLALLATAAVAVGVALRGRTVLGHCLPRSRRKIHRSCLPGGHRPGTVCSQQSFHQPTIVRRRTDPLLQLVRLQACDGFHLCGSAITMLHSSQPLQELHAEQIALRCRFHAALA